MANEHFENVGDAVEVNPAASRIAKPKYKLADLLAEVPDGLPIPMVDGWENMKPVGKEVLN